VVVVVVVAVWLVVLFSADALLKLSFLFLFFSVLGVGGRWFGGWGLLVCCSQGR
jgi:hypothetical protein